MSNYIRRLIARSVNQIETIQPRLPAIFEPHTNDAMDFLNKDVDIDPTHLLSKKSEFISALSDSNRQISSNPMKKKITTGKNDAELHTSTRSRSYKSRGLTNTNVTDPEMSGASMNFINPDTEYQEKVNAAIIDENVSHDIFLKSDDNLTHNTDLEHQEKINAAIIDENVSHDIFLKSDDNQTHNTDLLGSPDLIDQTTGSKSQPEESGLFQLTDQNQLHSSRHTLLTPDESTSEQVSAAQSDSQILNKLNDQPYSSNVMGDEINFIQQRNEVESNSRSHNNSNIENIIQPVIINQAKSNQKNMLQESIPQELSFHPFKGKLVEKSRIRGNDNSPIEINDPSQKSVIRVNIGRIEVRAVQPPTPPPQPQSKQFKPMLSLDDYLSQRNGV